MDSYIVRVYRRGAETGKEISGLVERVGSDARRAFATPDELWSFLVDGVGKPPGPDRKGRKQQT